MDPTCFLAARTAMARHGADDFGVAAVMELPAEAGACDFDHCFVPFILGNGGMVGRVGQGMYPNR